MRTTAYFATIILVISFSNFFSCKSRKSEPTVGKTMTITDKRTLNGQEKYMMYCQKCHPGGEAGLGPALNSNPAPGFIKKFQVRHGLGAMPSFNKEEISDRDLKDIIRYVKALKKFH
jgi:mono/diheme cytochrome c family protein